ncbi:hypothetical protein QUA54_24900 [Microcoleus sp. MOSTC5]|uniref:hypothetical protein n=1 Tax=Microcoleus sp. MOSTC5 TaxID=3055378 RepID=UPI002FD4175D
MRSTQLTTKLTLPISIRVRGDGCFDVNEQNLYLQVIVNTLTRRGGTVGVEKKSTNSSRGDRMDYSKITISKSNNKPVISSSAFILVQ